MGAGLAWYAMRHPPQPEARSFGFMSVALAWWSLCYALHVCSTDLGTQYLLNRLKYIGVLTVPPLWFVLALQYTRRRIAYSPIRLAAIFLPAILLLPVVLTDHLTHLWWAEVWAGDYNGRPVLQSKHAALYYLQVAINYAYLLTGSWYYLRFLRQKWQVYRSQAGLILIAVIIPLAANIVTQLGRSPLPWGLDAFFFAVSSLALGIAVFRYRFLAITPIAGRTILEHLPDAVIVIDAHGRILDANPAMKALMECPVESLVGRPLESAIQIPELRETLLEAVRADRDTATRQDIRLGGRVLTVTSRGLSPPSEPEIGTVILLRDITERIMAQTELENSYRRVGLERERLAMTIRVATDAIVLLDAGGQVLASNPAAERIMLTENLTQFPKPVRKTVDRARREDRTVQAEVDLDDLNFQITAAPVRAADSDGLTGLVLTMHDITHFKRLAELKDDFVSTVSHDLRAPLASILGYAQIARRETPAEELVQLSIERIELAAQRMADLITDLLDMATIEAGAEHDSIPVKLSELAEIAVMELEGAALAKGLVIHQELDPNLVVEGDPRLLMQVWFNLISNAVNYTRDGSITLQTSRVDRTAQGSVSDTGIGIAPADTARIFDKFFRSHHSDVREIPGAGLGLALASLIVERHGGQIWVESEPGAGSTFFFSIPLLQESPSPS